MTFVIALAFVIASHTYPPITLGEPVSNLISAYGDATVVTTDIGHVWTWQSNENTVRVTTDDNGIVRMGDLLPAPSHAASFSFPAPPAPTIAFGSFTQDQADQTLTQYADATGVANFPDSGAAAQFRALKISAMQELVLLFDAGRKLRETFFGETAQLARSGLLPNAPAPGKHFSAPALLHEGTVDYPPTRKQGQMYLRISVAKDGTVSDEQVYVSSGDSDLDRAALTGARSDQFAPARDGDTAVPSVYFQRIEFRQSPQPH